MAGKYKRFVIGSICKGKAEVGPDGKPILNAAGKPVMKADYIKIGADVALTKDTFLNLESKTDQLKGIDNAVANGKMSADNAAQSKERVSKIPDFVRFQIVQVTKNS